MFLLGGGINGGRVHPEWPDLATQLPGPGDLPMLNNDRDILAPILPAKLPALTLRRSSPVTSFARCRSFPEHPQVAADSDPRACFALDARRFGPKDQIVTK